MDVQACSLLLLYYRAFPTCIKKKFGWKLLENKSMSSYDQLEELRRLNKSLLEKLTINRDELKKQLSTDIMAPGEPSRIWIPKAAWDGSEEVPKRLLGSKDPALHTTKSSSSAARQALCTSRKSHPKEKHSYQTSAHNVSLGRSAHLVGSTRNAINLDSPVKRVSILNSTEIDPKFSSSRGASDFPAQYIDQLEDDGNLRTKEPRTPKSILLTPSRSSKKDTGHVTFVCNDESSPLETGWSGRPLLGYDWIAGLLEVKSPITNKSDQYFAEISEFRQVNRDECAHEYFTESGAQDTSVEDLDLSMDTHQCVYCYRVNQRLFTSPMDTEPTCPICKKRRGRRHVSLEEPAYIRVSIPRSTLLPPYKYRAHRRKSFDPTDSLALPSHCLAGWENAVPSCDLKVTSLDLKTSIEPNSLPPPAAGNVSTDNASYYASRATSDNLLNLSRSIMFHHRNIK
ncbi:migration and invasion-inhibitory protein [Leptodactylus fuscus]|uniref:migration and invasion-inhibitory protein n=1 Tax=Leptodactylus fuscus TaxID=238119 RepID=UPI003F4EE3CF